MAYRASAFEEKPNIMKHIDRKFIPHHKMHEASDGPKYLIQNKSALNTTPSHLGSFSIHTSVGIFLRALSLTLITRNFINV
jgi:hypothetical protein